jgi:hypothetical protein
MRGAINAASMGGMKYEYGIFRNLRERHQFVKDENC